MNASILTQAGVPSMFIILTQRCLLDQVCTMDDGLIPKDILYSELTTEKQPTRRPTLPSRTPVSVTRTPAASAQHTLNKRPRTVHIGEENPPMAETPVGPVPPPPISPAASARRAADPASIVSQDRRMPTSKQHNNYFPGQTHYDALLNAKEVDNSSNSLFDHK